MGEPMKLNLGCGTDIRSGYVNCDTLALDGVDKVFDLNHLPYPFDDNSADEVCMKHVLEHLNTDLPKIMEELHRILKPGGRLLIKVPYYNSRGAWVDPTHRRCFAFDTFMYFVKGHWSNFYSRRHFSSGRVKGNPSKFGKLIPHAGLRKQLSVIFGHLIIELEIELIK